MSPNLSTRIVDNLLPIDREPAWMLTRVGLPSN